MSFAIRLPQDQLRCRAEISTDFKLLLPLIHPPVMFGLLNASGRRALWAGGAQPSSQRRYARLMATRFHS